MTCATLDATRDRGQTQTMQVRLSVNQVFPARREACFARSLDALRFPEFFRGFGPIPGVRRIHADPTPTVGSTRTLENSDGTTLRERVTALDSPHHHAYTLDGLRPPLSWLARTGHAEWSFLAEGNGTRVTWHYSFDLTGWPVWPLAAPLLHVFMRAAMRRCLAAMARSLDTETEAVR